MNVFGLRPAPLTAWVVAIVILLLAMTLPVLAQDVTPVGDVVEATATLVASEPVATPEATLILEQPAENPIVDVPPDTAPIFTPASPVDVVNGLILALFTLFASPIGSPFTALIVSQLKKVPFFGYVDPTTNEPRFTGSQLNLMVAVFFSAIAWGAASLGFASQVDSIYRIIYAVLPILTGTAGNFLGNQAVYKFAVRKDIPVVNYARTPAPVGAAVGSIVVHIPPTTTPTPDVIKAAMEEALRSKRGNT